ncbi:purine-cytosine permease-like transporter [Asticcacaulis excentricus]|uniref:Purine-cytosine permease-like transporter n=1 Tax=Asticcacaulis excentricus (strain ATCC 15261 / DSM 4724 / KCTC 12464 / NCIMB 9791 / VKM B-1370 / CB 48) TaxID=573065 RepID=E8RVX8_ASTEC|nr:purine-cytosine permease-like transporter [Asticcacaulis excentricus]ADU15400.1 purine-cytosine permease-like transporter [Asticcacaulis excentricus CB 48]
MRRHLCNALAATRQYLPGWSWSGLFHQLETAAIAFAVSIGLTLVVFGFQVDSWMHEWANFLRHYVGAAPVARAPVNLFLFAVYLTLFAVVWLSRRSKRKPDASLA